jgi:hypothetical protein
MLKRIYQLGIFGYLLLMLMAFIFYKERTIFIDIAYHLFFITKDSSLAIQNFRFGAAVTQVFPLIAVKLGLSLTSTTLIYSLGFVCYYFFCYLLCGSILKRYDYALIILLLSTLFVTDTFYWIQSELPQGLTFMVTMFALLSGKYTGAVRWFVYLVICCMAVTVAFFHPLIIFPFTFIILFLLSRSADKQSRYPLYALIAFFIIAIVVKRVAFSTPYDKSAMNGLGNFATRFPYIRLYANKHFAISCLTHFYWLPLLSLVVAAVYISARNWYKLSLFLFFFFGYLLLVNVSFPSRDTSAFYIENLYLPLTIFVAFPFVFDVLPKLLERKRAMPVMALIMLTAFVRIYLAHAPYTTRLNWERDYLAAHANNKLVVDAKTTPKDILTMTWGTPYEFWLLSTIEHGNTASIVINENPDQLAWALGNKNSFLTAWGIFPYSGLPQRYFHFTDTVSAYTLVK